MKKENKIHLEGAKVYGPQDYEVVDELKELKEENRTLKDNVEFLHSCLDDRDKSIAIMQEENKKLKEENEGLKEAMKELNNYNKFRIQENERLKSDLSECECSMHFENDEVGYRKRECKKLKLENADLMGERDGLKMAVEKLKEENQTLELWLDNKEKLNEEYRKQIDKLKSDLGECECSFGFENDEVGFWKGEYKRLKKWIKDHCKGYGNLFPEDEMKRQWKKADKKRKNIFMEEDTLQELRDIGEL